MAMMCSPVQEVPSTPVLLQQTGCDHCDSFSFDEAVVPADFIDSSPIGDAFIVPGTPTIVNMPLLPWTPVARSISSTNRSQHFVYNSLQTPSFIVNSLTVQSPKEQVVPSTCARSFCDGVSPISPILHHTAVIFNQQDLTSFQDLHISKMSSENQNELLDHIVDATGDHTARKPTNICTPASITNNDNLYFTPGKTSQRNIIASFRRSLEAFPRNSEVSHLPDFLDSI